MQFNSRRYSMPKIGVTFLILLSAFFVFGISNAYAAPVDFFDNIGDFVSNAAARGGHWFCFS